MRIFLKQAIDYLFNKSLIISGICVLVLSIIDISNLNDTTISIFGVDKFEIGKLLYYFTICFGLIFGTISVLNGKEIEKFEAENILKSNKINDLESKLNEVVHETNELFNSYLRLLIKNLNFTHQERISVCKVYNNCFKLIGRTSVDPILMEMGRNEYPIKEGFIGKGWREGEFFINNLPDSTARNGITNYYNTVNRINPIPRTVIDNLKMKSRNFYIYRIEGYDGNPKAVLIFESLNPHCFTKEFIAEKIDGVKQPLIMFVEKNNGLVIAENLLGI